MERRLNISAFRNIGFENEKPSREGLILNHSLEKGKMGDLVILIGANNSGKSNVLDALLTYKDRTIVDRDITDLYADDECRKPKIELVCRKDDDIYSKSLHNGNNTSVYCSKMPMDKGFTTDFSCFDFSNELGIINELESLSLQDKNYVVQVFRKLSPFIDDFVVNRSVSLESAVDTCCNILYEYLEEKSGVYSNFFKYINENANQIFSKIIHNYVKYLPNKVANNGSQKMFELFEKEFGYSFEPTIYQYKQENIGNNQLSTNYDNLMSANFILSVLRAIKIDPSLIINVHNDFLKNNNIGSLKTLEKKLNRCLKDVAKHFNNLYYLDESQYKFEFVLESSKLFFALYRGEQSISLNFQSTGFRWFFDLYFNLFLSTKLKPGDIVVMDEPATNLHVKGQIELRQFLKDFAIKNDITIVIATHSPFLIDLDYLDELRIVSNKDSVSSIENDFSAINLDDPDSLLPVKESLTCENHVLIDSDQNVVFVEGITDYNYFVAMKKLLGYDNITFLPIKGVGKKGQEKEISERLIKIRKHNPYLLADGDAAGKAMKKANENNSELKVTILAEIDSKFKEVESLFSKDDAKKFGIVDEQGEPVKHHTTSSVFKNMVVSNPDSLSDETKENFQKVFDYLID